MAQTVEGGYVVRGKKKTSCRTSVILACSRNVSEFYCLKWSKAVHKAEVVLIGSAAPFLEAVTVAAAVVVAAMYKTHS